jgi:predicted porin
MKKQMAITIMAFAGSAMAQSSNGVQIYGVADMALTHVTNTGGNSRTGLDSGGSASSRLGFRGQEDLGGGLSAGFTLESTVDLTSGAVGRGNTFFNRESTVSIGSKDWGTIKLGRQLDFLNTDIGVPDAAPIIQGGAAAGYAGFSGTPIDVHVGGYQYDNSIKWMHKFGRVTTGLMYGLGPEKKGDKVYSAMVNYIDGGLSLGAGYTKDNFTTAVFAREVFAVKGMYVTGPWMFLANYFSAKDPTSQARIKPIELTVAYNFSSQVRVGGGIGYARATNRAGQEATLTQPFIGAKYNFSKRTHLYTSASFNKTSDMSVIPSSVGSPGGARFGVSSTDHATSIRVGIQHRF